MPLYEFECRHGHVLEILRDISECSAPASCHCGELALRILSPTIGYVQRECRYDSPIDGRPISSYAERREDLARNHCQEYDPEMKKDAARYREREQAKLELAVDESVERAVMSMDGTKREKLAAELQGGAEATPVRESVPKATITRISK
jgi:putative FmdB family regulatory protein